MRTSFSADPQNWPEVWRAAYRLLESSVVPNQLQAWIQPLELIETQQTEEGVKVRIAAPNDFSAQWVRDHYRRPIEAAFGQVTGAACELVLVVREKPVATDVAYEPPS